MAPRRKSKTGLDRIEQILIRMSNTINDVRSELYVKGDFGWWNDPRRYSWKTLDVKLADLPNKLNQLRCDYWEGTFIYSIIDSETPNWKTIIYKQKK